MQYATLHIYSPYDGNSASHLQDLVPNMSGEISEGIITDHAHTENTRLFWVVHGCTWLYGCMVVKYLHGCHKVVYTPAVMVKLDYKVVTSLSQACKYTPT